MGLMGCEEEVLGVGCVVRGAVLAEALVVLVLKPVGRGGARAAAA